MFGYKVLKDKYLRIVFAVSFFVLLFTATFIFSRFINVGGPVIIHFDFFNGIDFVGGNGEVFGILAVDFVIVTINFLLAEFIYQRERFMSYLISFATLILSILFLVVIAVISSINF
jgi:hypothetical protein